MKRFILLASMAAAAAVMGTSQTAQADSPYRGWSRTNVFSPGYGFGGMRIMYFSSGSNRYSPYHSHGRRLVDVYGRQLVDANGGYGYGSYYGIHRSPGYGYGYGVRQYSYPRRSYGYGGSCY